MERTMNRDTFDVLQEAGFDAKQATGHPLANEKPLRAQERSLAAADRSAGQGEVARRSLAIELPLRIRQQMLREGVEAVWHP